MNKETEVIGYLPDEKPAFGKLLLYALQQVIVMFPATIAVALITGFQVSTTLFASGLATICFVFITGKKIPMYYGSSFSYLSAISGLAAAQGYAKVNGILPTEAIQIAQFGIISSGLVSIAAGLLVKYSGRNAVEKVLPATITGSIAMIIGLTLAGNALGDAAPAAKAVGILSSGWVWAVSLATLLSTVLFFKISQGIPWTAAAAFGCCRRLRLCGSSISRRRSRNESVPYTSC